MKALVWMIGLVLIVWCSLAQAAGDATAGRAKYAPCIACHGQQGEGNKGLNAPALAGRPEWYIVRQLNHFRAGIRGAHPQDTFGQQMRPMAMVLPNHRAIDDVAAYLASLPRASFSATIAGDVDQGKILYARCAPCHGQQAEGNQAFNGPPLAHQHDWYLLTQLEHFKAGIRGSDPQDTIGLPMTGMAATLRDEAEMANVVAYIASLAAASTSSTGSSPRQTVAADSGCVTCHAGIEAFVDGAMMDAIKALAQPHGDPGGCVVCHGGEPQATTANAAHRGAPQALTQAGGPELFYPDPGSVWIAHRTCGQCHPGYAERVAKSLMNTEAGKLQGNFWSWGLQSDRKTHWGNYNMTDDDGPEPSIGTVAYKQYMLDFIKAHPDQMPTRLTPPPEVDLLKIPHEPNLAGITYSRQQCQRCHVGVTGREKRGDYRGAGCSSCHVPYSNDGFYEGNDPHIPKDQPGKLLVHRLQAGRKSKVTVGEVHYTGVPVETCNSCHNRGKRIGVSAGGQMEFPYGSPYDATGNKQPKLHTKKYLMIKKDLHHQIESREGNPKGGMLCQDCHTSIDIHGDGNIFGTTLAQVEIECSDCHGTPEHYPWELPIGYGEEFQQDLGSQPRGLSQELPAFMAFGDRYPAEDGYLLSTRGNPLGNVVKKGGKVILHSASGLDFEVPVLKQINLDDSWKNPSAKVAMMSVGKHMDNMECYACHADWVPQCYGCHISVDYSKGKTDVDWIHNANSRQPNGLTADNALGTNGLTSAGKVSETRSYLRWETPVLGVNGEGRVTPMMPGCQIITTVIDQEGNTVVNNKIWNTPEGLGLDHAAVQPHTAGRRARTCESCHDNPKSLGYGIDDNRFLLGYDKGFIIDLATATGEVIPKKHQPQIQAIPQLSWDLSKIVDRSGEQIVSVGSHWPLTGPLSQEQRAKMERTGLCLGCHIKMTDELWKQVAQPGFLTNEQHQQHMMDMLEAYAKSKSKAADR